MMLRTVLVALSLLLISETDLQAGARAVEIKINGLIALADLVIPDDGSIENGVILITHGTLAHKDMELVEALQTAFAERGIASLAHTLTLGINRRKGMYDCGLPHKHHHEDALEEIGAWIEWLKRQGAGPLTLLGHSRGGNQIAWYAAKHAGAEIVRVALLAPATQGPKASAAKSYRDRFKADLDGILDKARKLVASGKAEDLISLPGLLYCPDAKARASSILSYYGPEPRRDTPTLLPDLAMPVLVIAGSADTVMPHIVERVKPMADGKKITLKVIEDADHMFLDFYSEDAADLIARFINPES